MKQPLPMGVGGVKYIALKDFEGNNVTPHPTLSHKGRGDNGERGMSKAVDFGCVAPKLSKRQPMERIA